MGRPPTSGYCQTCRRRRVKCDKTRPACERCLKSGHKCQGYDLPLRVQNFTVSEASGSQQLVRVRNTTQEPAVRIPAELSLVAFRERMAFSHLLANYRWAPFWRSLFRTSPAEQTQSDAVQADYTGSLATALGYMGSTMKDPQMVAESYELNGKVIRKLHAALSVETKPGMARWAFTIIILSLYQYSVENTANMPHYFGMAKVVEYCGPECFQQEPMLTYLRQMRALHTCNSFNHDGCSFFTQHRWKTIPWLHIPKTTYDHLMDIYVEIPGIHARVKALSKYEHRQRDMDLEMFITSLLSQLHTWRQDWGAANPNAATEDILPLDLDYIPNAWIRTILTRALKVQTAQQAVELIIYNAASTYLMQALAVARNGVLEPLVLPDEMDTSIDKPADDPLYLPRELKHQWQTSIEGLRLMRLAPKSLALSYGLGSLTLAASPLGIIYSSLLGNEGLGRAFLSMICSPQEYAITHQELSVFWFAASGGMFEGSHVGLLG